MSFAPTIIMPTWPGSGSASSSGYSSPTPQPSNNGGDSLVSGKLTSGAWAIPFFMVGLVALAFLAYFLYHRKRYVASGGHAAPSEMVQHLEEFNSSKAV